MLGIVGHHLSVGTGLSAQAAARIAQTLGVQTMEISGIPNQVAQQFAREIGARYGEEQARAQIDVDEPEQSWSRVRHQVEQEGIEIAALGGYNDFALPVEKLSVEENRLRRFCRMAQVLDIDVIRVFGGDLREGMDRNHLLKQIISCFQRAIPAAEQAGVYLAIENHLRLVNDADSLLTILNETGSDRLKITLDFTNFYWLNADQAATEDMICRLAPYVVHTHFKNARYHHGQCILTTVGEGDLNIEWVIDSLLEAGYRRPFFVAGESEDFTDLEAVKSGFSRSIEYMNQLLQRRSLA